MTDALEQQNQFRISTNRKAVKRLQLTLVRFPKIRVVNIDKLVASVRNTLKLYQSGPAPTPQGIILAADECTSSFGMGGACDKTLQEIEGSFLLDKYWTSLLPDRSEARGERLLTSASALLKIRDCIYVTGAPGSGKTTLASKAVPIDGENR